LIKIPNIKILFGPGKGADPVAAGTDQITFGNLLLNAFKGGKGGDVFLFLTDNVVKIHRARSKLLVAVHAGFARFIVCDVVPSDSVSLGFGWGHMFARVESAAFF
jgi:hypothetical protein